ncbi:MAG: mechanosensitive ion channel family protein, partial [Proteobacteria bacterium]|nr:mechanosensitive ion channel family protein [Pseudomonadota bacterium]
DLFLLLKNVVRVIVIVSALIWLLSIWNVNLAPLFASAGIAGIAVALAAKDSLANFFGGISIFADKTFKVGDYIIIDDAQRGEVVEIGVRSTRIMTRDDVLITIPNSILANSKIVNESAPIPRFRIRVPVGVAYGSDLEKVEAVLLAVAAENPAVVKEPEARVRLRAFGSSSVDFELLCWVADPRLKGLEIHNLLKGIYAAFAAHAIAIPFPQQDVHIKGLPEKVGE